MNNKINWAKKLSSRKFWVAVVGFVTPLLLAFGVSESETATVTALIMAGADVVIYIIAEGLVDAAGVEDKLQEDDEDVP